MGAGASASSDVKPTLDSKLASREQQGQRLGVEFEVNLVRPALQFCKPKESCLLRVGYEALVLTKADEAKTPLTYFKYQDIMCWGSTSSLFQFKVFGQAMGRRDPVAIIFNTLHGKTLESVTLTSVHALMADMDRVAVTKVDFNSLKELLDPVLKERKRKEEEEEASAAAAASVVVVAPPTPCQGEAGAVLKEFDPDPTIVSAVVVAVVNKAGEAVDVEAAATTTVAAGNSRGDGSCIPSGGDEEGGGSTGGGDSAGDASVASATAARGSSGGPKEEEKGAEAMAVMGSDEFVDVVKKFGSTRAYTIHQAVDLLRLAVRLDVLDSFERMDFAMFLWGNILNRDSFQLVLNVFEDRCDRENLIARIQASNTDRASVALLRSDCPDSGGGIADANDQQGAENNRKKKKPPQKKKSRLFSKDTFNP